MRRLATALFLAQLAVAEPSSGAVGAGYNFTPIAESSGNFLTAPSSGSFASTVSLNDHGLVAFPVNGTAIYASDGVSTRLIAGPSNGYTTWLAAGMDTWVSLNNAGQVAFLGGGTPGGLTFGLWLSDGITANLIEPAGHYQNSSIRPDVAVNDLGQVAFTRRAFAADPGVFLSDGKNEIEIVGHFEPPAFSQHLFVRSVSNAGDVAFFGDEPQNNFAQVFRGDGAAMAEIAVLGPDFSRLATLDMGRDPALETLTVNENGTVAFWGERSKGLEGIFLNDGGGVTTFVDETDGFATFGHWHDGSHVIGLNDSGSLAFQAETLDGVRGIFDGPTPQDLVIALGDPLFDSTVAELYLAHDGMNNAGQLAFVTRLADGRHVVVRATPVPEPATILLTGIAVIACGCRRLSRRWPRVPKRSRASEARPGLILQRG